MPEGDSPLNIRMPAELKAALKEAATKEHRTLSGYVLHLLYQALEARKEKPE